MVSVPSCSKGRLGLGDTDTTWHSMKKGEIFYTDGIFRTEKYTDGSDICGI